MTKHADGGKWGRPVVPLKRSGNQYRRKSRSARYTSVMNAAGAWCYSCDRRGHSADHTWKQHQQIMKKEDAA